MSAILPDEFPFNRSRDPAPAAEAEPAAPSAPSAGEAMEPQAAPVCVQVEPLIEVEQAGRTLYRGPERRRSPRQALRAKAMYQAAAAQAHPGAVQVLNISMLGISFYSREAVSVGDKGNLRLELGPVKWAGCIRITHCEALSDGAFAAGGEFVGNELSRKRIAAAA